MEAYAPGKRRLEVPEQPEDQAHAHKKERKIVKLEDLTIGEARELARMFGALPQENIGNGTCPASVPPVGTSVCIRTVTHYYTGRISQADAWGLVLEQAAWIPDTGRWTNFLQSGDPREAEPYPGTCTVALAAIVDICAFPFTLPSAQK